MNNDNSFKNQFQDLIEIIHFTEDASVKLYGVTEENDIFQTVAREFMNSRKYDAHIVLLDDARKSFKLVATSIRNRTSQQQILPL